jgi:hypothetical protein
MGSYSNRFTVEGVPCRFSYVVSLVSAQGILQSHLKCPSSQHGSRFDSYPRGYSGLRTSFCPLLVRYLFGDGEIDDDMALAVGSAGRAMSSAIL